MVEKKVGGVNQSSININNFLIIQSKGSLAMGFSMKHKHSSFLELLLIRAAHQFIWQVEGELEKWNWTRLQMTLHYTFLELASQSQALLCNVRFIGPEFISPTDVPAQTRCEVGHLAIVFKHPIVVWNSTLWGCACLKRQMQGQVSLVKCQWTFYMSIFKMSSVKVGPQINIWNLAVE